MDRTVFVVGHSISITTEMHQLIVALEKDCRDKKVSPTKEQVERILGVCVEEKIPENRIELCVPDVIRYDIKEERAFKMQKKEKFKSPSWNF